MHVSNYTILYINTHVLIIMCIYICVCERERDLCNDDGHTNNLACNKYRAIRSIHVTCGTAKTTNRPQDHQSAGCPKHPQMVVVDGSQSVSH